MPGLLLCDPVLVTFLYGASGSFAVEVVTMLNFLQRGESLPEQVAQAFLRQIHHLRRSGARTSLDPADTYTDVAIDEPENGSIVALHAKGSSTPRAQRNAGAVMLNLCGYDLSL